jgi:hypothetical protein
MSMTRDQIIELITQVVGDELTLMRADVERLIAQKPLPPFLPPAPWAAGRHAASVVVRHVNGMFMARRDTEREPPHEDWLPVLVGIAGLEIAMEDDRTVALRGSLSDGQRFEMVRALAIPLLRGLWAADTGYAEGDRVLCNGEWQALSASKGVEPGSHGAEAAWLKVGGKSHGRVGPRFELSLDDDGNMIESGRTIGSIKPLVRELLTELVDKQRQVPHD